jgi:3-isopropylmalate/(R)-2-methylmalate dehydratase large subunit
MGGTVVEKILGKKSGMEAKAGRLVVADIDVIMAHDSLGPMAIEALAEMGKTVIPHREKICFMTDHLVPTPARNYAQMQKQMRDFAKEWGIRQYGAGDGICHQLLAEKEIRPGQIVMPAGILSKDLVLFLAGKITEDGANYQAMELTGETISSLSMGSRLTMCNMGVEMGAKAAIMEADETTRQWLLQQGVHGTIKSVKADADAVYSQIIEFQMDKLEPQIAKPHKVDNVVPLKKVAGTPIHEVVIGTCTNGRLEDLEVAAAILKGKQIVPDMRLIVIPASRSILLEAMDKGVMRTLVEAGASVLTPGCGPCVGVHGGIPADGENVLSTANRNFKGRMGNPNANIFLGSPAAAAAAALEGKIADPRKYLA